MNDKKIRVCDFVADFVNRAGINHVFTVSGGGLMFLTDGLACNKNIETVCCHHEQAAAMAAVAYAKYEGLGCAYFTTGCGGTNAATGLLHAYQDGTACLFISGQVKLKETSRNISVPLRQFGVQEADIVSIVEPITKYAVMIENPEDIAYHMGKALYLALDGHRGPVWIDIPMDVQSAFIDPDKLKGFKAEEIKKKTKSEPLEEEIAEVIKLMENAERPVIVAGQGVRLSGAAEIFKNFAEKHSIPFVASRMGFDVLPTEHPLYIGRIGNKGTRAGNFALQNADFLLVLGSRLSVSSTGHEYAYFAREAKIAVVDIDPFEHKKGTVKIDKIINADVKKFLNGFSLPENRRFKNWAKACFEWKEKYPVFQSEYYNDKNGINMYLFTEKLSAYLREDDAVITDAGSAVYVPAQGLKFAYSGQRYITSGAQAEMGFTLPGAVGVCAARYGKDVIGITGDGSLQMNIQELQTIVQYAFPVKLFVWNNDGYLSIRATQRKFFEGRFIGTDKQSGVSFPDLAKIAWAYGIKYFKMASLGDTDSVMREVINYKGPVLCEVVCVRDQAVIPAVSSKKLEDGRMVSAPLEDMYPFLPREEFYKNMIVKPLNE